MDGVPGAGVAAASVLTSLLYPLEVTEKLGVDTTLIQGWMDNPVGSLEVSSDVVSGVLVVTIAYKSHTTSPELLDVATDIVSGLVEVLIAYKSHTISPEAINVSTDIASGSLVVAIIYVTHTIPPEGINVFSDLVSGSLAP
jgi:ABC-type enterobactin transport system permease subunit